ncbi:Spo0B domain-containing protein [Bacillus sp. OR9]|nr:Spo0B domain-containing protein [Bacillus sp. OR9]
MIIFSLSVLKNILVVIFLLVLVGNRKNLGIKNIVGFIILYSFFTTITYNYVDNIYFRIAFNLIYQVIGMNYILSLSAKVSIYLSLLASIFQIPVKTIAYIIVLSMDNIFSYEPSKIFFAFIFYILFGIITMILYKKKVKVDFLLIDNTNFFPLKLVLSISLFQIMITCVVFFTNQITSLTAGLMLILIDSAVIIIMYLVREQYQKVLKKSDEAYLENLEQVIQSIRAQRHDHMNHLHVISNLIHDKNYEETQNYINELNSKIEMDYSLLNIRHPSLIALLQTKIEFAKLSKIKFEINVKESVSGVSIQSYELIQIVGNIIDNAFDAELASTNENKEVTLTIDKLLNSILIVSINNINSFISSSQTQNIFSQGYSLKENHKGIGLFTVANILKKNNSYVEVESNLEHGTTFYIFIPYTIKGD